MKSLLAQMNDNNEQLKTQIRKMTVAIIAVALLIIVSFVMIVTNLFE